MKLIVGLGNPGYEYKNTRHNIGFMAIDKILEKYNEQLVKQRDGGIYAELKINKEKIIILKPQQYINLSGDVISKYLRFYKIDIKDLLIICDDLDLDTGKIKLKYKGSSGGHNGLKNIEANLKTNVYNRIKIGISNNKNIDTKDYVLGKLTEEEKTKINKTLELIPEIIYDYLEMPFDKLMSKYNTKQ